MLDKIAQKLASSTAELIGIDIIITDEKGMIIGASDPSRRGTLHEPSLEVIRTGQNSIQQEQDVQHLQGVKSGVTLPIEFTGKRIGTIALAGVPSKVTPFGMLVKKHTELILSEKMFSEVFFLRSRAIQNLLEQIAAFDPEKDDETSLLATARGLGFELQIPRIAVTIELLDARAVTSQGLEIETVPYTQMDIMMAIRTIFNRPQDISTMMDSGRYEILRAAKALLNEKEVVQRTWKECEKLKKLMEGKGLHVVIGIGSLAQDISCLPASHRDGWKAVTIGKNIHYGPSIYSISDLMLEDLLTTASRDIAKRYRESILAPLKATSDSVELINTFRVWCEHRFSPSGAAKALSIHKNTLNYRINKIESMCNIDSQNFRELLSLYIAILINELSDRNTDQLSSR